MSRKGKRILKVIALLYLIAVIAFLASIPYRFYPLLALWLVVLVAWTGRDLGPMARAERRAFSKGLLLGEKAEPLADAESLGMRAEEGVEPRWWNAVAPIAVVIAASFAGLWITGRAEVGAEAGLRDIFGAADPRAGAVHSLFRIASDERLNHRALVIPGVLGKESVALLTAFFRPRRRK